MKTLEKLLLVKEMTIQLVDIKLSKTQEDFLVDFLVH